MSTPAVGPTGPEQPKKVKSEEPPTSKTGTAPPKEGPGPLAVKPEVGPTGPEQP